MTDRRGFLKAIGFVMAAPAIVRAESLMKIVVPKRLSLSDQILDLDISMVYPNHLPGLNVGKGWAPSVEEWVNNQAYIHKNAIHIFIQQPKSQGITRLR